LLAAFAALLPRTTEAVVVERVVAVVGEKAILLSDLRKRARPFLIRLYATVPDGPPRAAHESRILSQLIERMVDEVLESRAATRNDTTVSAAEIDKALRNIARAGGVSLSKLFKDIRRDTGMSEVEYRQEVRRQVLEGKLLNRMVQNQRVTKKELRDMYEKVVKQERKILLYTPAWVVLRVGEKPNAEVLKARTEFAGAIVKQLREGGDFTALAEQFSEDPSTARKGGSLGIRAVQGSPRAQSGKFKMLSKGLEGRVLGLEPGEVTEPFRYKDALVVMTIISRQTSRYTSYEAARQEMFERVRGEKLQAVKTKWLKDLRQRTHVDVRL
jgi:peptidyl-prolyl cis-trans isomerase SurA